MDRNSLYAEEKWARIVQQSEPIVATIANGSFTPSDLTKLASVIARQSELASALFKREVRSFQIQAESFTDEIKGRLQGAGVSPTSGNIEKVINKVFELQISKNVKAILDKIKASIESQKEKFQDYAQSLLVERQQIKQSQEFDTSSIEKMVGSILKEIKNITGFTSRIVTEKQESTQPTIIEEKIVEQSNNEKKPVTKLVQVVREAKEKYVNLDSLKQFISNKITGIKHNALPRKNEETVKRNSVNTETLRDVLIGIKNKLTGFYINRRENLKDAVSWIKGKTRETWKTAKKFVGSIKNTVGNFISTLLNWSGMLGIGYMLYPAIKNTVKYFMDQFNFKETVSNLLKNTVMPILEDWFPSLFGKKVPVEQLNRDGISVNDDANGNRTVTTTNDNGTYNQVQKNADGSVSVTQYDYNPEVIKDGPYNGWIQTGDEPVGGNEYIRDFEFVNPKTGEVVSERARDESYLEGPVYAKHVSYDGKQVLENGRKVIQTIQPKSQPKQDTQINARVQQPTAKTNVETAQANVSVKPTSVEVKQKDAATTSIESPKVAPVAIQKQKVESNKNTVKQPKTQVSAPLNLNTTNKAGNSADPTLPLVNSRDLI